MVTEGANGGVRCDRSALSESESCPFVPCDVDCQMSEWAAWSRCSADCGQVSLPLGHRLGHGDLGR